MTTFLDSPGHGYSDVNEFVSVAVRNQLSAEAQSEYHYPPRRPEEQSEVWPNLLRAISDEHPSTVTHPATPTSDTLFVLTNRLSPVKVATRVLSNLFDSGGWPVVRNFQEEAAKAARQLGLRLRAEDERTHRVGFSRRWIGYPVGEDERAASNRYIASFTLLARDSRVAGPLVLLGLANVENGHVALTANGWALAAAPSPLMDAADGLTLSNDERSILAEQVLSAPAESAAVGEFLDLVKRAGGSQKELDRLLAVRHADWTQDLTLAHRAAMIGRMFELGFVLVEGRGPAAMIRLLKPAQEVLSKSEKRAS